MLVLQIAILLMVGIAGTAVVLTREPASQVIGLSFFGLLLALMFFIFQAPDVALSQIVIGAVALPLMILLALAKVRLNSQIAELKDKRKQKHPPKGEQAA
jgi:energy-converting hydrogenase B subunit D